MVNVAILCGGVGSRLWPLSRKEKPKQFMKLPGAQYNLFQETILRINQLELTCSELIIVSNHDIESRHYGLCGSPTNRMSSHLHLGAVSKKHWPSHR